MIEHIVRMNERIENILDIYQISLEEMKNNNSHITDFNNLKCGMKLLIPYLSKNVEQILESTEGFVQKYYPKISEVLEESNEVVKIDNVNTEIKDQSVKEERKLNVLANDNNLKRYIGTTPPTKPYKGNIKI